ncbi:MAG: GatB/YqeY domain-containing protein [Rhodospirillaceae bacterium]|nr:GatB/YqeY domain-containing protein [Rhodospirillaceae bacterium]
MLRDRIKAELKEAMKARERRKTATLRLISAALKDRDIAARTKGVPDGIDEMQILGMLQTMVKQRRESIDHYEQGGRLELAEQEREEIEIINDFLPPRLDEDAIEAAVGSVIDELGAASVKDMGRTMAELRQRYAGQMDFGKASALVKSRLAL